MKTRFFLSTAAILISSPVFAADILIAEPEPVEFVRVCDAYGTGYFYIPGTQTCMRLSGYVRSEIKGGDDVYSYNGHQSRKTYAWRARGELRFDTVSDTELGSLRTVVELRSQWDDGADRITGQLRFGYIDLNGVRAGVNESIFWHWTGYLGKIFNDDVVDPGMYHRTNVLSYTYAADNGFSAILGLEQGSDNGSDDPGNNYYRDGRGRRKELGTDIEIIDGNTLRPFRGGSLISTYAPNVLFGAKYAQNWGSVAAVGAYDSEWNTWVGKIRADVHVTDFLSVWLMAGYKGNKDYYAYDDTYTKKKANGHDYYYRLHTSQYGDWGGDWALWGGAAYAFTDRTVFNMQLTYDDSSVFSASTNVTHMLVPGLTLVPEVSYVHHGDNTKWDDGARVTFQGQDAFQGAIRLQRNF